MGLDKTGNAFDGCVYVGTGDDNSGAAEEGQVIAFDTEGATPSIPLWLFKTDHDVESRPVISTDGSVVYAVTDIGKVYAIPTATGGPENWPRDVSGVNLIDPAGSPVDGTVYVATDDGHLHAFDPANGNDRPGWASGKDLGAPIMLSSPAVGPDGTVYIGTDGNRVFAFNPDGTTKWEFPTPSGDDVRSTPEVGADGVTYVGSNDGNLYALASVAVHRNYRITYVNGQQGYVTSANLDTNVVVDDTNNWLDGSPLTRGPGRFARR